MTWSGPSEKLKLFVSEYLDSVELVDVLLEFHSSQGRAWDKLSLARELRSSPASITKRLSKLEKLGFISSLRNEGNTFRYDPRTEELDSITKEIAEINKDFRNWLLQAIYEPRRP